MLQCVEVIHWRIRVGTLLQCAAVCRNVLQCVVLCCSAFKSFICASASNKLLSASCLQERAEIASLLEVSFAKETYNFIDPTNQSHPTSTSCLQERAEMHVCVRE